MTVEIPNGPERITAKAPSINWGPEGKFLGLGEKKPVGHLEIHIEEVPHSISPLMYTSDGIPYDIETPAHRRYVIDGITYEGWKVEHGMLTQVVEPNEDHITRGEN